MSVKIYSALAIQVSKIKGFSYSKPILDHCFLCPVRRSHGCRADTLTLVSEAMIDQSMVMAKTGLGVWLDLLCAIGRLDGNRFFIGFQNRWAFSWCHPNHSPLHLLLLQPLTLLLLLPLHQRLVGRMAPGRLYGRQPQCTLYCAVCALYSPSSSPSPVTGPRG